MRIIGTIRHFLFPSMLTAFIILVIWIGLSFVLKCKEKKFEWCIRFFWLTSLAGIFIVTEAYQVLIDGFPAFFMEPNLIPIVYTVHTIIESPFESITQMAYNIVLFFPFGFLLPISFLNIRWNWKNISLTALCVVLVVEGMEFLSGRYFDVDDILLNVLGTVLGYACCKAFTKLQKKMIKLKN